MNILISIQQKHKRQLCDIPGYISCGSDRRKGS